MKIAGNVLLKKPSHIYILIIVLAALISGCNFTLAADITPPPGYSPSTEQPLEPSETTGPLYPLLSPDPGKGAAIYLEKCAPCHGTSGLGDGPQGAQLPNPVPAIGTTQLARQASPALWYEIVTEGNLDRFMPPFASLSDRQRWDVIAYVWSLSTSPEIIEQGKSLYQSECASCHGTGGKGDGPEASGNLPDFTRQEFMAGKSETELFDAIANGSGAGMPGFADQLPEEQRWAITSFLRSLSFVTGDSIAEEQVAETALATSVQEATDGAQDTSSVADAAPGTGSISGEVINGSSGTIPTGLEVQLHGFDHTSIVVTGTVPLSDDGTYSFEGVEMPEGRIFLTSVDFEDVTYASEAVSVEGQVTELDLPIQVYEPTTDQSALKIDRLHYFFEPVDEQTVRIVELFIISNPSGKTLIAEGPSKPVLDFQVPPGAINLQIQDGEIGKRFIKTDRGFGDTIPIRPGFGAYQLLFSYELPLARSLEFSKSITLPVNAIVILVPEKGIAVKGDTIQDGGIRDVQGTAYRLYNATGAIPGEDLRMTIVRSNTLFSSAKNTNLLIGLSALGAVLLVSGMWLYRKNRTMMSEADGISPAGSPMTRYESRESLMDAILALDDLYQEGKLPEEAYLNRRAELKDRLKDFLESS